MKSISMRVLVRYHISLVEMIIDLIRDRLYEV